MAPSLERRVMVGRRLSIKGFGNRAERGPAELGVLIWIRTESAVAFGLPLNKEDVFV